MAPRGQALRHTGWGGCCPHFIRRARSLPWPRCGVWGSSLQPVSSTRASGEPLISHPNPDRAGGETLPWRTLGQEKRQKPPWTPAPRPLGYSAPEARSPRGSQAQAGERSSSWGGGGVGDVLWQRSRVVGSWRLRTVGICPHHLAVHGHGEGQAQDLRGQQGPGRAAQDHGQWPPGKPWAWGPRGAPWARPRPAFPLEWVWPPWAPLVSGPRSSRLGPQQLPSTPLSDCDHPSGSVWL